MIKRKLIIDTDPGIDDAVAIAIAINSDAFDIMLISTVMGNVNVDKTTLNALKLVNFFKSNVKVAKGSCAPLIKEMTEAKDVHGESGMDGYQFTDLSDKNLINGNAINEISHILLKNDDVTLCAIGPLTNIALLLKMYPEVKPKIKELVLMGGSITRGNKGVMSEYNFYSDPEAAKIVFNSGINIVMVPLDVGLKALVYPEDSLKIKAMNKTGEMIYSLFQHYRGFGIKNGLKMYDSCAIAYLLKPEMFEVVDTFVDIETNGTYTSGASIVDLKNYLKKESNAKVCIDINQEMFKEWFLESINKCI